MKLSGFESKFFNNRPEREHSSKDLSIFLKLLIKGPEWNNNVQVLERKTSVSRPWKIG